MQIFRPFNDHTQSAAYLDDTRIRKQIIVLYQISTSCLQLLGMIPGQANWATHPFVKAIYNRGMPYLPDLVDYMIALNKEFQKRGQSWSKASKNDSFDFKLDRLKKLVQFNYSIFSDEPMPLLFIGEGKIIKDSEEVFDMYKKLLIKKWRQDKYLAKCSIKVSNSS